MKKLLLLLSLCGLALRAAALTDLPGEPLTYKHADGRDLKLFVFKPADWRATDRRPALVFFHGGSWTGGAPSQLAPQSTYLASRGLVCISVQYRLIPAGDTKDRDLPKVCVQDAKSAFRWVRAHAAELGIDPARLGVGGASAGGYLAGCIALVPGGDDPADNLQVPLQPAALVLFNPVIGGRPTETADSAFVRRFGDKRGEFLEQSPANHVTADAPPAVILHGAVDTVIAPVEIRRFEQSMAQAGARCDVHFYDGQGHSFFNRGNADGRYFRETTLAADRFLASLGWLQGEPVPENLPTSMAKSAR
ncbi:MAG: Acetylxylan esterase precursor [Verrucomicrobiota bacterium]|jgi:acetyl esterase/lipase